MVEVPLTPDGFWPTDETLPADGLLDLIELLPAQVPGDAASTEHVGTLITAEDVSSVSAPPTELKVSVVSDGPGPVPVEAVTVEAEGDTEAGMADHLALLSVVQSLGTSRAADIGILQLRSAEEMFSMIFLLFV